MPSPAQLQKEMEKMAKQLNEMNADLLNKEFEYCWSKISNDVKQKVKKNFVKELLPFVRNNYFNEINARKMNLVMGDLMTDRVIIPYICAEHYFRTSHMPDEERAGLQKNNEYRTKIVNDITSKILLNEHSAINPNSVTNRFSPEITMMKVYAVFINSIILRLKDYNNNNDIRKNTICRLIFKFMSMINAVLDLLADGYDTEALSLWRSLHELECTIIVIQDYEEGVAESYVEHLKYLPLEFDEDNVNNELINEMNNEMKKYKGITKPQFINFGWLLGIEEIKGHRFNFKETLSFLANQNERYEAFKFPSKFIHPSAVHITINRGSCYIDCIYQTYQSFLNISNCFDIFIGNEYENADIVRSDYLKNRNPYNEALMEIYNILLKRFETSKK